jgi:ribulose-phosphate 3-epimerase
MGYRRLDMKIAPSILSADFAALGDAVALIEAGGADQIHVDVMDGHFVPNLTIGPPVIECIKKRTRLPIDVHLMIEAPDPWIDTYVGAGADLLTVHVEACPHLQRTLARIREAGAAAGAALNPATLPEVLEYVVGDLDLVLVMSVNPGFGGQTFIPATFAKLRQLKRLLGSRRVEISVDGGVRPDNAGALAEAGAGILVAGSSVFGAADPARAIASLRSASEVAK